ncbi:MAG TPA: hypothetical protein EYG86_00235 [Crocinitomicaceae bacterium]|nr:hypothetical protein [Crocinitomicaceae bacterium]
MIKFSLVIFSFLFLFSSCKDENYIPKPPTYLRLELPNHSYKSYTDDCPYELSIPEIFNVKQVMQGQELTCHKDINLGPLNGTLHFTYIDMEEPLATYVNYVNDKIDEHKIKATAINDYKIILPEHKVYCTFFALEGNVASPFQFYMTDSVSKFASGVVYFNSSPNYDSLKPTLNYLKVDLDHFIEHFKWKN